MQSSGLGNDGCAQACMTLALARMDVDGDGSLSEEDLSVAQRLVDATKDELLNAGVVAALILSIMFPLAYEENEALIHLQQRSSDGGWDWRDWSELTSFRTRHSVHRLAVIVHV